MAIFNGGPGADVLVGTAAADSMFGFAGNDRLSGGAGNDILDGGLGADILTGGAGNDIFILDSTLDRAVEAFNQGIDTVRSTLAINLSLHANVENAQLLGTSAVNVTGSALVNSLTGNAAANVLNGMVGADKLTGLAGNDTYIRDNAGDIVVEAAAGGTDTVQSLLTYTLGANVENLVLLGVGNTNGTGNTLNNTMTGNAGNNILGGGAGNDIINGGAGDDQISGNSGADTMRGGTDDDEYGVDSAGDVVVESAGQGYDMVYVNFAADPGNSYTYVMGANIEGVVLMEYDETNPDDPQGYDIHVAGNAEDNYIEGNGGDNVLMGFEGDDELRGGYGRDILIGGAGDDILNGNQEPDTMIGGEGNDEYWVGSLSDTIVEFSNQGVDEVFIRPRNATMMGTLDYVLSANIENVTIMDLDPGTFISLSATGNALGNGMWGNSDANTLTGLAGDDALDGGDGEDLLIGGEGQDTFMFTTALDAANNVDVIADFAAGEKIHLSEAIFTSLVMGGIAPGSFVLGTAAVDGNDFLIYDTSGPLGELYYDADGNGAAAQVLIVALEGAPSLSVGDFLVIA